VIVTFDDNKYEVVAREPLRFVENPDARGESCVLACR
jgi:hypothetical protein